jgi:hypothetical protein
MEQISFTDSNGVLWTVREDGAEESFGAGHAEHLPGSSWLKFESDLEVRRLWHYPDDWRGLNPIQLESLLERASTVIARFRPVRHRRVEAETAGQPSAAPPAAPVSPPRRGDAAGSARRGTAGSEDPESR